VAAATLPIPSIRAAVLIHFLSLGDGEHTFKTPLHNSSQTDRVFFSPGVEEAKGRAISDPALEFNMLGGETGETSCIMRNELRITGNFPTFLI